MKRKKLNMREQLKLNTIKDIMLNKITKKMGAEILICTIRNINLLINKYQKNGYSAFIHKNTGKISNRKISHLVEEQIINLYKVHYLGFNYCHFKEFLEEEHKISVSYNYLSTILIQNKLYSPRLQRKTRKNMKTELNNLNNSKEITNIEIELNKRAILDLKKLTQCKLEKQVLEKGFNLMHQSIIEFLKSNDIYMEWLMIRLEK